MSDTSRSRWKWIAIAVLASCFLFYSLSSIIVSQIDTDVGYFHQKINGSIGGISKSAFMQGYIDSLAKVFISSPAIAMDRAKEVFGTKEAEAFAVLASNENIEYFFMLPITVLSWRRLGADALIILIGTKEQFESDTKLNYVLSALREIKTRIFFIQSKLIDSITMGQVSRIYAAALDGLNMSDSTVLITADADMLSFQLSEHMPDLKAGERVLLFHSRCCGMMKRPNDTDSYPHYTMNTVAMTVALWREVMNVSSNMMRNGSGDLIAMRLYDEFGEGVVNKVGGRGTEKWFMDQSLLSAQLHRWIQKNPTKTAWIRELPWPNGRYDGPIPDTDWKNETLEGMSDVHFARPLYGPRWFRIAPLLRLMFTSEIVQWCIDYHNGFMEL